MAKHRVTTTYRNRLGLRRQDVRVIEVADDNEMRARVREIIIEIGERPGCVASGATTTRL